MPYNIFNFPEGPFCKQLLNYELILVSGADAITFLNGQITSNLNFLLPETFQRFSRLDFKGNIKYSGYIISKNNLLFLMVEKDLTNFIIDDFNKFIISEDVTLEIYSTSDQLYFTNFYLENYSCVTGVLNLVPGFLFFVKNEKLTIQNIEVLKLFDFISTEKKSSYSESIFSLFGSHRDKGCYVGQEIVSKIENNRGARRQSLILKVRPNQNLKNNFLVNEFIKLENNNEFGQIINCIDIDNLGKILLVNAKRENHLEKENLNLFVDGNLFCADVILFQSFIEENYYKISSDFFFNGVDYLNQNNTIQAQNYFSLSLLLNSKNLDSLEALGVLYGRSKKYHFAHLLFDRLIKIEPNSIMAHSNKSLFYMEENKIEEAEREKDIAQKLALENSSNTENKLTQKSLEIEKLNKQLIMYQEVLDIDPYDEFAFEKCLELNFNLGNYAKVIKLIDSSLIEKNPKIFVWKYRCHEKLEFSLESLQKFIPDMLEQSLRKNDKKSSEFLKKLL